MQITSIEVFRGNHGVAGNAVIGVPAGEKLTVMEGDTVRVHMTVDHRGPRIEDAEVYTAIGWQVGIVIPEFVEAYVGRTGRTLTFEESSDFVTYEIVCDVPIGPTMMPIEFALYGNVLDMYAKIINVPGPDIYTDPFQYGVIEVVREGEFQNLVVTGYDGVPVGEPLMVTPGQTVRVHMSVDYRGPAIDGAIYTGIGWRVGTVIEQFLHAFTSRTPVHFEDSYEFTPHEFDCDVDIQTLPTAEELLYGTLLDMYAKIIEVPGADIYTPFYIGVIAWSKPIEEYDLLQHTFSHFAYIYEGDAEVTTITLRTDPFKPADWVPEKFIAELEREARENGVRVLETKVYVDTSPLFWTDYVIEVTGTPPPGGVGVGVLPAIPLFVEIILLALAVAFGIWVITWAVKQFLGVFQTKPGLDDMKVTWGKEALILVIRDSEKSFERPLTPVETLEGMSEGELRHLLNEIAEEEVPTGVDWVALGIVGGVAILGVGVAIALSAGRPRE